MSKFTVAAKRFGGFMKRNAFYFLIILCIASVATVIALAVTHNSGVPDTDLNPGQDTPVIKPGDDDNQDPPSIKDPEDENPPAKKLTFIAPTNGTILQEYDMTAWNPTMNDWGTHFALDFVSEDLNVYATADGTVKEIGYTSLKGNYIVIEHEEGYTSIYKSLEKPEGIKKGDKVKQGQLIGKMSDSKGKEELSGAHLHFEIEKDGKPINPLDVIVLDEK